MASPTRVTHALPLLLLLACCTAKVVDFGDAGGIANERSSETMWNNSALINSTLASLKPGDTFVFPNTTFHIMGGIEASGLESVIIRFDGTLVYSDDVAKWPRNGQGRKARVLECMRFKNLQNVTFSSSGTGVIDGKGAKWWGECHAADSHSPLFL